MWLRNLPCPPLWVRIAVAFVLSAITAYIIVGCTNPTEPVTRPNYQQEAWERAVEYNRNGPNRNIICYAWFNGTDGFDYECKPAPSHAGPPSTAQRRVITWTGPFEDMSAEMRDLCTDCDNAWLCDDPASEITITCWWYLGRWECDIDWGTCAGYVGDF